MAILHISDFSFLVIHKIMHLIAGILDFTKYGKNDKQKKYVKFQPSKGHKFK